MSLERILAFIPVVCVVSLIAWLLIKFFQYYIVPHFALDTQTGQQREGAFQGRAYATNYSHYSSHSGQSHPIPQYEIPSNTPYPTQNLRMPVSQQTTHLPQSSRLIQKKLVVCEIFPNDEH
ncbi:integral component of membrane [Sergentomyia squamirostris]